VYHGEFFDVSDLEGIGMIDKFEYLAIASAIE